MPLVTFDGQTYSLKSRKTVIPTEMLAAAEASEPGSSERFKARMWINANTRARGYVRANPLAGLKGVVELVSK